MHWLLTMVRAIGQALGITPAVGHVPPTQDSPTGGKRNIAKGLVQRAKRELKAKPSVVQQDIQDQSSKTETSSVRTRTKKSSTAGTQSATPAPKPVKSKRKPAAKAVQPTTQVKSRNPAQKAVQAERGATGKQSKPTARKTRQHVK